MKRMSIDKINKRKEIVKFYNNFSDIKREALLETIAQSDNDFDFFLDLKSRGFFVDGVYGGHDGEEIVLSISELYYITSNKPLYNEIFRSHLRRTFYDYVNENVPFLKYDRLREEFGEEFGKFVERLNCYGLDVFDFLTEEELKEAFEEYKNNRLKKYITDKNVTLYTRIKKFLEYEKLGKFKQYIERKTSFYIPNNKLKKMLEKKYNKDFADISLLEFKCDLNITLEIVHEGFDFRLRPKNIIEDIEKTTRDKIKKAGMNYDDAERRLLERTGYDIIEFILEKEKEGCLNVSDAIMGIIKEG